MKLHKYCAFLIICPYFYLCCPYNSLCLCLIRSPCNCGCKFSLPQAVDKAVGRKSGVKSKGFDDPVNLHLRLLGVVGGAIPEQHGLFLE